MKYYTSCQPFFQAVCAKIERKDQKIGLHFTEFLEARIDEILQDLPNKSAEYAAAELNGNMLYEMIQDVITWERDLHVCGGDLLGIREYLDQQTVIASIAQRELYWQGYRDCVALLQMIGVLALR